MAGLCRALLVLSLLAMPVVAATWPDEVFAADARPHERIDAEPGLGEFLDAQGYLHLPPDFTGSVNPTGYRIISGEGEPLRFEREAIQGFPADGWNAFGGIDNGCNGSVSAIAVGDAGEVYVGGDFTLCGDTPANHVARFDTVTQTWSSLGSGAANGVSGAGVYALALSDDMVYVGGWFTQAGGEQAMFVARFDTSTQTWSSLGSGAANGVSSAVWTLAVSGSMVYAGGNFTQAGGEQANRVARFDTSTQTWSSLGIGAANGVNGSVRALALSGSTVSVGGGFTQAGGESASGVARFDTSTQTWSSLGSGAANGVNGTVRALALSGSTVYVGGSFTLAGGESAKDVAVFDTSTQTWSSLGSGAANGVNGWVNTLTVSGSTVYVGGQFTQAGGEPATGVAGFDTPTQTWSSLGSGGANGVDHVVYALAVSGSTVHVGGWFTQAGGEPANHSARFDISTQTWSSSGSGVGNGVNGSVHALAVSGSTVYVGGEFTQAGGEPANHIARFDTSTQTWSSLGSGAANGVSGWGVYALAVADNTVYVGGGFTQAGGEPATRIARFDTLTQTWSSLGTGSTNGVSNWVRVLAVSGSSLYVGGDFTQAGGEPANRVARFDTSTQTWSSLGNSSVNGVNSSVRALAVSGSMVYVGGGFTQAGGEPANFVAGFDTSTQTWFGLGSGAANGVAGGGVYALAVSGNTIYVGGWFAEAGGEPANNVARFDTSTATWSSLGSGEAIGVNGTVHVLAVSGSSVYVGGGFLHAGGEPAYNVARFDTSIQTWSRLGSGAGNGANDRVYALASPSLADGAHYVGGYFYTAGGLVSSNIAMYYRPEVIFANGFE